MSSLEPGREPPVWRCSSGGLYLTSLAPPCLQSVPLDMSSRATPSKSKKQHSGCLSSAAVCLQRAHAPYAPSGFSWCLLLLPLLAVLGPLMGETLKSC